MMEPNLQNYERLFGQNQRRGRTLDRQSLPKPLQYLTERRLLRCKPPADWAQIRCPVHKGGTEKNPSMGVSLMDGHFRCHSCGASGGDLVALHQLITRRGFLDAVRDLGGRFHD